MTTTADYTPLESLLLFQSLLAYGVEPADFARISDRLKKNTFVRQDATYDAARLSPESLQGLFLRLLGEELSHRSDGATAPVGGAASPQAKKRKLQSPPLSDVQDARQHVEKLPLLAERLYARYRDDAVRRIREDESHFDRLQLDIRAAEQEQRDRSVSEKTTASSNRDGGAGEVRPASVARGDASLEERRELRAAPAGALPGPRLPAQGASGAKESSPLQPSPGHQNATAVPLPPAQPSPPPPGQPRPASAQAMSPEPSKSPRRPHQVLQAPRAGPPLTPRPISATPQPAVSEVLQRPDIAQKAKVPPHSPSMQLPVPGTLKWETPYQPHPSQAAQQRGTQNVASHQHPAQQRVQSPGPWSSSQPLQYPSAGPVPPHQLPPHGQLPAVPQARPVLLAPATDQGLPTPQAVPANPSGELSDTSRVQGGPPPEPAPPSETRASQPPDAAYQAQRQPPQGQLVSGSSPVSTLPVPPAPFPGAPHPPSTTQLQQEPPPLMRTAHPRTQFQPSAVLSQKPSLATDDVARQHHPSRKDQNVRGVAPGPSHPQAFATPGPSHAARPGLLHTPSAPATPRSVSLGSGTRWKSVQPAPPTPNSTAGVMGSPGCEPLSPVLRPVQPIAPSHRQSLDQRAATIASQTERPAAKPRGRPQRNPSKAADPGTPASKAELRRRDITPAGPPQAPGEVGNRYGARVKQEEATPRPLDEAGEATAEEDVQVRRHAVTPTAAAPRPTGKRKRRESSQLPGRHLAAPPTHVLWTRGFPRVSASALDQISSHRYANMFAHQIRDRDAPGYKTIVLRPQDLKSIRAAISAGNKAAAAAAAALPGGDPGSSSVWLPISEELVPPRGIINSAQLERELVHMFSNAIMYNLDPYRGPGPAFMWAKGGDGARPDMHAHGDASMLGYKVDENSVVNDTRAMFVEVEKLLSDLRSTEAQPDAPPGPSAPGAAGPAGDKAARGAGPHHYALRDEHGATEDEADETAHTEAEGIAGGTIKRRRMARGDR